MGKQEEEGTPESVCSLAKGRGLGTYHCVLYLLLKGAGQEDGESNGNRGKER